MKYGEYKIHSRSVGNHNTSFSSLLMTMPNNLDGYAALGWKGLQGTNTSLLDPIVSYEKLSLALDWIHNTPVSL